MCGQGAGAALLCEACAGDLPLASAGCAICAIPVVEAPVCGSCLRQPPAFDASFAALSYVFPADRLVQALKYRQRLALADLLAAALARGPRPDGNAILVPMPLHARRLQERGFNQAAEIGRRLARLWGLPFEADAVERVRDTPPQASLPWLERRANVRGAFTCGRSFSGRTVVVIDDVMTTGATLDELARTLKSRGGAVRVENRVVARTPLPA